MRTFCAVTVMGACVIGAATQNRINGLVLALAGIYLGCTVLLLLTTERKDR